MTKVFEFLLRIAYCPNRFTDIIVESSQPFGSMVKWKPTRSHIYGVLINLRFDPKSTWCQCPAPLATTMLLGPLAFQAAHQFLKWMGFLRLYDYSVQSQLWVFLSPKGYLEIPGDSFGGHDWGWGWEFSGYWHLVSRCQEASGMPLNRTIRGSLTGSHSWSPFGARDQREESAILILPVFTFDILFIMDILALIF